MILGLRFAVDAVINRGDLQMVSETRIAGVLRKVVDRTTWFAVVQHPVTWVTVTIVAWILIAGWLGKEMHHTRISAFPKGAMFKVAAANVVLPVQEADILSDSVHARSREIVKFEAEYFKYLAMLTIPVMAGLVAILAKGAESAPWRFPAICSLCSFAVAISLVTIGYASRNLWMMSEQGDSSWRAGIEVYFQGVLTALAYISALGWLVRLGFVVETKGTGTPANPPV
jgi:hypothetical protein